MAYNLQSRIRIIEEALHLERLPLCDREKNQLECLLEKVTTLQQILENLPLPTYNRLKVLQGQIIDFSHRAEDIVESATVDRTLVALGAESESSTPSTPEMLIGKLRESFLRDLQKVIEEIDSLISLEIVDPTPESSSTVISLNPVLDARDNAVGLDGDIHKLQDLLTGTEEELKIIPIVGMGGIGKTTLARKLYVDPLILSHFDRVAWVTLMSEEYRDYTRVLLSLLSCITRIDHSREHEICNLELALHQNLFRRRYLIVLDNVCSTTVWDRLRVLFPDYNRQSRIVLTTRDLEVAKYVNTSSLQHHNMHLLNEVHSWNLFREKVFGNEECIDPELEKLGREISNNCKGLPLAIGVVSVLLSHSNKTRGFWKHVANDISTALLQVDERFSKIFSVSYDNLPHHLRPCLLYIGVFPEGAEIRVSRIQMLWAAESFLKPIENKTPEEAAEEYLEALANRNLLLVLERKSCGKMKKYAVHDFVRDLCIRQSYEESFVFCGGHGRVGFLQQPGQSLRHALVLSGESFFEHVVRNRHASFMDVLLQADVSNLLRTSRLLRVLHAPTMYLCKFPQQILQGVNIRYLYLHCNKLPSPISRLLNLETLIVRPGIFIRSRRSVRTGTSKESGRSENIRTPDDFIIPSGLWKMRKLRHFILIGATVFVTLDTALEKLQTLWCDGKK